MAEPDFEPERWEAGRAERRASIRALLEAMVLRVLARERGRSAALLAEERDAALAPFAATLDAATTALESVAARARAEAIGAVAAGLHAHAVDHEMVDQAIEYGITGPLVRRDQ